MSTSQVIKNNDNNMKINMLTLFINFFFKKLKNISIDTRVASLQNVNESQVLKFFAIETFWVE